MLIPVSPALPVVEYYRLLLLPFGEALPAWFTAMEEESDVAVLLLV